MYSLPLRKYLGTPIYPGGSQQPLIAAVVFLSTFLALAASSPLAAFSPLPDAFFPGSFSTDGRWMTNAQGQRLTYAGVNWPGHGETMVPEGLQYASIEELVTKIKGIGMNAIRLTWAVEMVDDIFQLPGGDVQIRDAFNKALDGDGQDVFNAVMRNNPEFKENITRLEVFDAIAAECATQKIYLHLDNHVSKAGWCCKATDGNSFFGDRHFDVEKWKRALAYMAKHGKSWPTLVGMGLRNELREPLFNRKSVSYGWHTYLEHMPAAAAAVHGANEDLLIFFSGLGYDTELRALFAPSDPASGAPSWQPAAYNFTHKIVLEVHDYDMDDSDTDCAAKKAELVHNAFGALDPAGGGNVFPLAVTEWGHEQAADEYTSVYATCLRELMAEQQVGWTTWVLGGSYYIRSGRLDHDESWGLLDHEWKGWRCPECIEKGLKPLVRATLGGLAPVVSE
ncbi:MAG: hypothetical protein Q9193_001520 [Seirophora villosa]